jgi:asparagine synthase (glutamine-hydrolysing)
MCGIVGVYAFGLSASSVSSGLLDKMRDTMSHRGPDGSQSWISGDGMVGLGFRRLAIIDLSSSAMQPMSNEDGQIRVVFNGEIYNHAEIRAELEKLNRYHWKTDHSDTEVIIHAFEEWGIDCLHKFRGMFAIAIWDARERALWLVRDRIGIKPLYYAMRSGRITFASEIKALLQDPDQPRAVCEEAFFHYLSFLTTPAPQTLFEGIKKLSPGSWICIRDNGQVREERYWDVLDYTTPLITQSEETISQLILDELRTAVKLRKVSDVPVGVFLSGGVDSSTNAVLFSEDEQGIVKTFSIGYDGNYRSYQNEFSFARLIADKVKSEHYEKRLTVEDLLDFLPKMVYLQDEPIADPVCVPVYYVSKLARENGVTVCQVGEGADELFWGYPHWKKVLGLQRFLNLPFGQSLARLAVSGGSWAFLNNARRFDYMVRHAAQQPIFWSGAEAFPDSEKRRLLSPRLQKKFKAYDSWEAISPIYARFEDKAWERSPLNWMSYVDLNFRLPELLLMRVDKMSMGVSLEGRVPFLDHRFVELAMSIPESVKTRNGRLKYILKKAVRGTIPDAVIDRPKQGFSVPVYEWFFERLGDVARQELESFCIETDFLDVQEVRRLFARHDAERIWYLLNFVLWWKSFILKEKH